MEAWTSSSLDLWEYVEYLSTAIVFVAAAGEYCAEFTKWPVRGGIKDRLAKASTLVLVIALAGELLGVVKTSQVTGQLLISLGERAASAERSSIKAEGAASNALTLAQGARRELDSFKQEIVSVKRQASDAESHLAEALRRAEEAEKQAALVHGEMLDRDITPEQRDRMLAVLKARPPGHITIESVATSGRESAQYAQKLAAVFRDGAHWEVPQLQGRIFFSSPVSGVILNGGPNSDDLVDFIMRVLIAGGVAIERVNVFVDKNKKPGDVWIIVAGRSPMRP